MKIIDKAQKIKIPGSRIKKLKWGVAGCGYFLENTFLPSLKLLKRSSLVSVYSSDINRAKFISEKFDSTFHFDNYKEFLKSDFDCLYISSQNSHHYKQVIEAAKAGKNILCEKPLSITSEEANEMVKVCKENNVFLTVNYVNRYHPLVLKAKELIQNQLIGKIVSINVSYNMNFAPNDNYRFIKEKSGGGVLWDLGTHMIDLLRFLGGDVESIRGYVDNVIYKSEVEDYASAVMKFNEGGFGNFNVSYNNKQAFNRLEIIGYKGTILIENLIGKKNVPSKLTIDLPGEGKKAFRKRGNKMLYTLRSVQKSFIKKEQPLVTGEDAAINLKIMEDLERQCQ